MNLILSLILVFTFKNVLDIIFSDFIFDNKSIKQCIYKTKYGIIYKVTKR